MSAVATKQSSSSLSPRKLAANRGNARKSTGPRSAEGKARSAQNATTHGMFCHAAVLPGEDEVAFHSLRAGFMLSLNPRDTIEILLVDRIALASWKLRRLQEAEFCLNRVDQHEMLSVEESEGYAEYEQYHTRGAAYIGEWPPPRSRRAGDEDKAKTKPDPKTVFDDEHPIPAAAILATQINREDEKSFQRLSRYEQRLENQILRMMRELRQLRKDRQKQEPQAPSVFTEAAVRHCEELAAQRASAAASKPTNGNERPKAVNEKPKQVDEASDPAAPSKMQNEPTASPRPSDQRVPASPAAVATAARPSMIRSD